MEVIFLMCTWDIDYSVTKEQFRMSMMKMLEQGGLDVALFCAPCVMLGSYLTGIFGPRHLDQGHSRNRVTWRWQGRCVTGTYLVVKHISAWQFPRYVPGSAGIRLTCIFDKMIDLWLHTARDKSEFSIDWGPGMLVGELYSFAKASTIKSSDWRPKWQMFSFACLEGQDEDGRKLDFCPWLVGVPSFPPYMMLSVHSHL